MDLQIFQDGQAGPLVRFLNVEVVVTFTRLVLHPEPVNPQILTVTHTSAKSTHPLRRSVVPPQLPKFRPVLIMGIHASQQIWTLYGYGSCKCALSG